MLLEFAVSVKADSRKIYKQLADIYKETQATDKIQWLMETTEELPEFTKSTIQKDLSSMN